MQRVIAIDADVHKQLVTLLDRPIEYGGALELDKRTMTLVIRTMHPGTGLDAVLVPYGLVQFHTHPAKCSRTRCALGIPSAADMGGFAETAAKGRAALHCIYGADGVYCVSMDPIFLARLRKDKAFRDQFLTSTRATFEAASHHIKRNMPHYPRLRDKWLQLANRSGFRVRLLPLDRPPQFTMTDSSL